MKAETPVKLESLQFCLNGLSQDSGVGSSQECRSSQECPSLQLEKIVVPSHLTTTAPTGNVLDAVSTNNRKRKSSESSLSEFEESKKPKLEKKRDTIDDVQVTKSSKDVEKNEQRSLDSNEVSQPRVSDQKHSELCIMCNINPKNSIFLHGSIGHMCSCYKCAIRTWGINKRCPLCNCKARNVIKVFTA